MGKIKSNVHLVEFHQVFKDSESFELDVKTTAYTLVGSGDVVHVDAHGLEDVVRERSLKLKEEYYIFQKRRYNVDGNRKRT